MSHALNGSLGSRGSGAYPQARSRAGQVIALPMPSSRRRRLAIVAASLLACAAGCAWVPPTPVPEREEFAKLKRRVESPVPARLEVELRTGGVAPTTAGERRATWLPADLPARRTEVLAALRALGLFRDGVEARDVGARGAGRDPTYVLALTDSGSEVEYLGMSGNWPLAFLAWSWGGPLAWWVRDETFAGKIAWNARFVDGGDGREIASRRIDKRVEQDLNDWDRGWSLWDALLYAAAPISEANLRKAATRVLPFAEGDATLELCRWLVEDVRPALPAATPSTPAAPELRPPVPVPPEPEPPPSPPAAPRAPASRTRVLCVGIASYASDPEAPFADRDAQEVADALAKALRVLRDEVTLLRNGEATGAAIRAWLESRAAEKLGPTDRAFVFFAGRGATDEAGEPLLLPTDARAEAPGERGLPLRRVAQALSGAGETTIVLDCAFQGRIEERGPDADREPRPAGEALDRRPGLRLLAAAYPTGEATSRAGLGHGLFTASLLAALSGKADRDGDGRTTLGEAAAFLETEVAPAAARGGVEETPALLAGDPGAPLAAPAPGRG